ncbi:serine protein kinase [Nemania sp. FL0916]|nr:serine protein kinase [Nemania sp. FL0916]
MDISPPPTPPSCPPEVGEDRFKTIGLPCEWVEMYHPGGYHPVLLGDVFHNGQYKVIRKLGEGSFSTVWLARDLKNDKYVAVKILISSISRPVHESQILHHLMQVAPEGAKYITQLIDEFEHRGPNGVHQCLVFEPMGPDVNHMVEELPQFKPRKWGMQVRYPYWMAKSILKQSLQSLVFLHEIGIALGDFQPGNMLFALRDIDSESEDKLRQREDEQARLISPPVERLDGKQDKWAPRYLCLAQPLAYPIDYAQDFKIKLSDMGGAYFFEEPPTELLIPVGLRPPEYILTGAVNKTFDIWSFGCLVFELVTGQQLFYIPGFCADESEQDDDHLLSLTTHLGPLPDDLYGHWKTSSLYFTPERKLYNCALGGVREGEEPLISEKPSMEDRFDDLVVSHLDQTEARKVKAIIRRILQYDPAKRPSSAELLRDPWLSEDEIGSGCHGDLSQSE